MVFYAYISEITNDVVWRLLLTFADGATADEWWRAVSTSSFDFLTNSIKRVNPQVYTHKVGVFNVYSFYDDARIADISKNFRGRLIITLLNDRGGRGLDVIPYGANVTDNASGNWFYIRSKADSAVYWAYDQSRNRVVASRTSRSLFRVVADDIPEKTVIIGSDRVSLTIFPGTGVNINREGDVIGGLSGWEFDFSNFASGRFVATDVGLVFENVDAGAPKKPGWELVN